jgi:hypothetical protein
MREIKQVRIRARLAQVFFVRGHEDPIHHGGQSVVARIVERHLTFGGKLDDPFAPRRTRAGLRETEGSGRGQRRRVIFAPL